MHTGTRAATGARRLRRRQAASRARSGVPRAADRRRQVAHYGAPALFLLAVTVAVLLIRAGLESGSRGRSTSTAVVTQAATTATTRLRTTTASGSAQYYTVQ